MKREFRPYRNGSSRFVRVIPLATPFEWLRKRSPKLLTFSGYPDLEPPHVVLRFEMRAGRTWSAGRTEVHLVATTSSPELTFCPFHADLGRRKGSSPCQLEPYRRSPTSITSSTRQKTYSGITPAATWGRRNVSGNFTRALPARPMPKSSRRT